MPPLSGLEWPVVFNTGCEKGIIPYHKCQTKDEIQEEWCVGFHCQCLRPVLDHQLTDLSVDFCM
jgi:hypothetical protein